MVKVAIIGDIHLDFSEEDQHYFADSDYDLILIVGDLSNYVAASGCRIARRLAGLNKPALFLPGNHDTVNLPQLIAEIKEKRRLASWLGWRQGARERRLGQLLGPVTLCGCSLHPFQFSGVSFDVIAARPYAVGGSVISCQAHLRRRYGVGTLEESLALLKLRIDASEADQLIFLSHNGPFGLGDQPADIWGCDFSLHAHDFGDRDLQLAVQYALDQGRRVVAVVGGHMHHRLKHGGLRTWHVVRDGVHYVNAARVPRCFYQEGVLLRHHVRLTFDPQTAQVEEMLIR